MVAPHSGSNVPRAPPLLEAVNRNGLAVFLLVSESVQVEPSVGAQKEDRQTSQQAWLISA
jgi:hypothetical protein